MNDSIFNYQGSNITFQIGNGDVMVNATQMAKKFNKRPIDWLRLPSTDMFINELEAVRKSHRSDLLATENGTGRDAEKYALRTLGYKQNGMFG